MSKLTDIDAKDIPCFLVFSLCATPVSLDELVAWGFARPVDLWRLLDEARRRALFVESTPGSGQFVWPGDDERGRLWSSASVQDWQSALSHPEIIERAVRLLHRAAERRERANALALSRGLVNATNPEQFPGGALGFMRIVLESCRLFVHAEWRSAEVIDRGIEIAEQVGDRAALAMLLGVRSNVLIYGGDIEKAEEYMRRSCDLAATLDNPEIFRQASIGLAMTRILVGEFRAGIDAFEKLLGNVPHEILPAVESLFTEDGTIVLETIGTIALAYLVVGQPARAVDLLHRAEALGMRKKREDVVQLARLYLGLTGAALHDHKYGQPVLDYWMGAGDRPFFAWFATILVALLHRERGEVEEARAALARGHEARMRAGFPYFFSGELLDLLEWLEDQGAPPIDGMTLQSEIDRYLGWYNIRMKGIAHHAAARSILAKSGTEGVDQHLAEAETLLRRSGAVLDLAYLLETAAAWDDRNGRSTEAKDRRCEAEELRRSVQPVLSSDAPFEQAHEVKTFQVVELGRLLTWGEQPAGWGEIAARLCSHFAAERAVIVEVTDPPRLLGVRGGSTAWAEAALKEISACERDRPAFLAPPANEEDQDDSGRLVVVPFSCRSIRRFGWVGLENRRTRPMLGPDDSSLLEVLSAQISVLLENATLWQELQAARTRLEQENRYYREEQRGAATGSSIIGHSPALQQTLELVSRVAKTSSSVLITGETGVGKELVAREIHQQSSRQGGPFIAVHIASLSPGLVASGLFGHERGAFTGATDQVRGRFELAHGGTLFLDEIGELGLEEQVRLLRVLQEGTFERVGGTRQLSSDFRLIAATNRDLGAEVKAGRFREDLFYRLKVFPIPVPPLRERQEDIPTLALFFMDQAGRRLGRSFDGIGTADMERLRSYPWPGNVRELMHTIERAAVLSDGPRLVIPTLDPCSVSATAAEEGSELVSLAESERRHIRRVLEHTRGRVTGEGGAAEILGLKPSTLNFRIRKLGLNDALAQLRRLGRARSEQPTRTTES